MELPAEHPVRITHPKKVLWPEAGITKLDLLRYYAQVAPALLSWLRDRPLTVIRYPNGIHGHSFFQKDAPQGRPEWVRTHAVWSEEKRRHIDCVIVDSVATLLWLGNLGCLELHVGFTTAARPEEPTHVAFDLDPSVPGFEPVRTVALGLHQLLQRLNLPSVCKTSGASGLQVFIKLAEGHTYEHTRVFTRAVAEYLQHQFPSLVTLERLTRNRRHKVYVDYPQHGRHRTLIAAYSPRAAEQATVSTPLSWRELEQGALPTDYTLRNVPTRLKLTGDLMTQLEPVSLRDISAYLERAGVFS
ncbi:non-homologous end-joining DNA ligase [Alicyclobacillus contaminans]|uniref:non-homologous end-joining DNA ligase n=1 Tax=Alicyclobacillus contaminans TaxID=392016 RepID=UPI000414DF30|nr:non-homologous end-joining DNA ligase [Alicyclobacillus contaminans]